VPLALEQRERKTIIYIQQVARLSKKSPLQNHLLVDLELNPCVEPLMGRVTCHGEQPVKQ